jgi:hypothetical protein
MSWVTVRLERGDQGAQARRENDEVAGAGCGGVGVGGSCGHEDCCSGSDGFGPVGVAEDEFAFEDVPRLVVGVMDVEGCRAASAPFVDLERCASGGEWVHANHSYSVLFYVERFGCGGSGGVCRAWPPAPSNVCKVFKRNDLGLYFRCGTSA